MRAVLGLLIKFSGWAFIVWALVTGLGFFAILMVNFVGTHGAESGGDILTVLGVTLVAALFGLGIAKLGSYLCKPKS